MDKKNKNPNVPNLRFSQFIEPWSNYVVSELLSTFPTNSLSWDQLTNKQDSSLKNLHYGLIHNGFAMTCITGDNQLFPYIKHSFIPTKYALIQNGDLILADASEDRKDVGRPVEMLDIRNQKIVSGLHTIHARNKTDLIANGFKGFYFQSSAMKQQIFKIANGSKIYGISSSAFNELKMSIPEKKEQKKIVDLMIKIEERILTQIKIIDSYFSLSKAISNTLIGQSKGNTRLRECLNCYSSNTMESVIKQEDLGDYPVYGANGIIKKINNYEIEYPSIAIVKDGSGVGKIFKLSGKYSILSTLNYLTSKPGYDIDYIYYALKQKSLKKYVVGSGIPHIYFKDYEQEKIYIPQNELQQHNITSVLQSIDEEIGNEIKQLKNYELLKKYLLKNMFV